MILGLCSLCRGTVSTPDVWFGITPPRATCEGCGAVAADGERVVEMVRPAYPAEAVERIAGRLMAEEAE